MWAQRQTLATDPAEWLGGWHPLAAQLGSADGLAALAELTAALRVPPLADLAAVREFLRAYHERILAPVELPAILRAFHHTEAFELRELIAFDASLGAEPALTPLAAASRRVGRAHLERLRPLRDDRFVRRYLGAVETGQAAGWHVLVYGMTLSVYSLPLRQGLASYAAQTVRGFIQMGVAGRNEDEARCRALFDEALAEAQAAIATALPAVTSFAVAR